MAKPITKILPAPKRRKDTNSNARIQKKKKKPTTVPESLKNHANKKRSKIPTNKTNKADQASTHHQGIVDHESNSNSSNSEYEHEDLILQLTCGSLFIPENSNKTTTQTDVVSSNPTLNYLLSTPIDGSVEAATSSSIDGLAKTDPNNSDSSSQPQQQEQRVNFSAKQPRKRQQKKETESKKISYIDEIRKMMHCFGDVRQPLMDSAQMIETIVQHQMFLLLMEVQNVAKLRKSRKICVEDFIFLLRHNFPKLARFIRFIKFKDMKSKLISSIMPASDDVKKATPGSVDAQKRSKSLVKKSKSTSDSSFEVDLSLITNDDHGCEDDESTSFQSSSAMVPNLSERMRTCRDFVMSIVETPLRGDYQQLFEADYIDDNSLARNLRLDEFTKTLSLKDYLYYQSCRSMTFFGISKASTESKQSMIKKFQDWLYKDPNYHLNQHLDLPMDVYGWESLQYFAHETLATLVELALVVKEDQQRIPGQDANIQKIASINQIISLKQYLHTGNAITSDHIMEAMRRFENNFQNVFTRFNRSHGFVSNHNQRNRILCIQN